MATETEFRKELAAAINRCSRENGSNTPDFILAEYLSRCLDAYDIALVAREKWYGKPDEVIEIDGDGKVNHPGAIQKNMRDPGI